MSLQLSIPDSILQAIPLPEQQKKQELLKELAIALYSQDMLSFGKARELAQMGHYDFSQLLGERGIYRHYGEEELEEDSAYASNVEFKHPDGTPMSALEAAGSLVGCVEGPEDLSLKKKELKGYKSE